MEKQWENVNLSLDEIISKNRNDYKFPRTNKRKSLCINGTQKSKNQQQQRKNQQQQGINQLQRTNQQDKNQQPQRQILQRGLQKAPLFTKRCIQREMQHGPLPKIWDYSQIWDNRQLNLTSGKFGNRLITAQKGTPGGVIQVLRTTEKADRCNRKGINVANRNNGNIYVEIVKDDNIDWEPETTNGQHDQHVFKAPINEAGYMAKNNYLASDHPFF